MSYLEKARWKKAKNSEGKETPHKVGLLKVLKLAALSTIFMFVSVVTIEFCWKSEGSSFNPYKGVISQAWGSPPDKALDFIITKARTLFSKYVKDMFPLDHVVSIVAKGEGEKIGTEFDPVRFVMMNIGKEHLKAPAADAFYPSMELARDKKMTEVLSSPNLSTGFEPVAFRELRTVSKFIHGSSSFMNEPILVNDGKMQGLEKGFERKFADGEVRLIKPNDTWALFRPNTHGLWRRSQTDKDLGTVSLEPEETLPVLFWLYTDLCDKATGKWNVEATQWLVSRQYPISYGVYVDPDEIEIVGRGLQARFVYEGRLPVDMVIVRQARNQKDPNWERSKKDVIIDVSVPILNRQKQLCFFGSWEPDQSAVIPYSMLTTMDTKKEPLLLGNRTAGELIPVTLQDILDELQQVRTNRGGRSSYVYAKASDNGRNLPSGLDYSSHVTKTARLTEISNGAIGDAETKNMAVENMMRFTNVNLPYTSDWKKDKEKPGYNGPTQITMSPLMALLNRGKDCDGIATFAASLWLSAEHKTLAGLNNAVALASLDSSGIGHLVPLFPNVWEDLKTDPFPNHILLPYEGVETPYAYMEPTGAGYNKMHQTDPTKRAYEPRFATKIKGLGITREVSVLGFNQFKHLIPEVL